MPSRQQDTAASPPPDACRTRWSCASPAPTPMATPLRARWTGPGTDPPPTVLMAPERRGEPALAPGERVLARIRPAGPGKWEGRTIKRLSDEPGRILGVFRPPNRLVPTDRRSKAEWRIPPGEDGGAEADEIVAATPLPHTGFGLKPARITERLGRMGDARSVSLIVIHAHDIPQDFPEDALQAAAAKARATPLGKREDLRALPLVTIDGEDARDFDDAVFAEPDGDGVQARWWPSRMWRTTSGPGSPLDRSPPAPAATACTSRTGSCRCCRRPCPTAGAACARRRTGAACSSRCGWTPSGRKTSHRFGRGLMRSAARLTYEQAQDARDSTGRTWGWGSRACLVIRRIHDVLLARPHGPRHARPRFARTQGGAGGGAAWCPSHPARAWTVTA